MQGHLFWIQVILFHNFYLNTLINKHHMIIFKDNAHTIFQINKEVLLKELRQIISKQVDL